MKKIALFLAAMTMLSTSANADYYQRRDYHHHHHRHHNNVAPFVGGAIVGGVLGAIVAQPRYYAPPSYYAPPPHCWYERQTVWDPYFGDYVTRRVRICN
jgi:hypothetical protein